MLNQMKSAGSLMTLGAAMLFLTGCGPRQAETDVSNPQTGATAVSANPDKEGWWCVEHGIPEGICAQCSTKLAAEFQKKGDWCKEHERPESQCFICHPELAAKFAVQYETKFGQQPPKPTE